MTPNGLSLTSVRDRTDARRMTRQRGDPGVRLSLVCSFALAQVQRELAEIVATPTRISLYGDGERRGYPEECRLCYNLPCFRGISQRMTKRTYVKSLFGALAIMMASGMILDFEFVDSDGETYIRVWSPADRNSTHLR